MKYAFNLSQSGDQTLITITGDLTIRNVAEISADLLNIPGQNVIIELNDPFALDLTFIQLLVKVIHTVSQRGGKAIIKPLLKETDLKLFANTGFSYLLQLDRA